MALTICSGMWGPRREDYARIFLESFDRFWPKDVRLAVYADGPLPKPRRASVRWIADCEGYSAFVGRHAADPAKCGREQLPAHKWKSGAVAKGYNFKFDAVRFAGQGFIPEDAAKTLPDGDVLCWLDADVQTVRDISASWIEDLIGNADGAYLGRVGTHSEIGFWAVRLSPDTREMLSLFGHIYRSDALFRLSEWHSAFVWDSARIACERAQGLNMRNLTPRGHSNVFQMSVLSTRLIHHKGDRKAAGWTAALAN